MDKKDKLEKVFNYSVGCVGLLGVLATVVALFVTLANPSFVIRIIEEASGSVTMTPSVIVSDHDPLPTYTPYPTFTPYPDSEAPSSTSCPTQNPCPTVPPSPMPAPILVNLPFEDTFDAGARSEWQPVRGIWRMVDGSYTADASDSWSTTLVGDTGWADYAVDVDVLFYDWNYPVRIIVRAQDGSYMAVETNCCDTDWILVSEGSPSVIAHTDQGGLTGGIYWHENHLRVEVRGTVYTAYSDGAMLLRVQDSTFTNGRVGLAFRYPFENTVRFDNFQVTELH